jgi:DNA-binding MarR family transcriptional regulator
VLTLIRLFRALERVDSGLTPQQYRILKLVGAGGERSARLAEKLAVAKPTLTATADGLVAAGLVHREAEIGDRRVVRLHLTPAGAAAMARADATYSQWLTDLLGATAEPGQILTDLDLLGRAMDELRSTKAAAARQAAATLTGTQPGGAQPGGTRLAGRATRRDRVPDADRLADPVMTERKLAVADAAESVSRLARLSAT